MIFTDQFLTTVLFFIATSIRMAAPLIFSGLGELLSERAGVLNLGVEGMMAMGAVTGFIVTLYTGNPWLGLAVAAGAGAALSQIHAFVSVTLRGNQVVSGLALTMLGIGSAGLLG
ncbi:hypothetical protein LCGC14_3154720, partial [marine sediment metagenome]